MIRIVKVPSNALAHTSSVIKRIGLNASNFTVSSFEVKNSSSHASNASSHQCVDCCATILNTHIVVEISLDDVIANLAKGAFERVVGKVISCVGALRTEWDSGVAELASSE